MQNWIAGIDYPEWGGEEYLSTLSGGYLCSGESPKNAYWRVANAAAKHLSKVDLDGTLAQQFFNIMWNGWFIPATPILANLGTEKGLPVSCFGSVADDSIDSIWTKAHEIATMSKNGGGTSIYVGNIRERGASIRNGEGGISDGVTSFLPVYEATVNASKQTGVRRGACAAYYDIEKPDAADFVRVASPSSGSLYCPHLQTGLCIGDEFMESLETNIDNRNLYKEAIKMRIQAGYPYMFYRDNANKARESWWNPELTIKASNLC